MSSQLAGSRGPVLGYEYPYLGIGVVPLMKGDKIDDPRSPVRFIAFLALHVVLFFPLWTSNLVSWHVRCMFLGFHVCH